ncbi:MAG: DedA family protein [Spirochaetia bacterium]|nr:MAG: DedA family protein [Spirochaetia bacterium]
MFFPLAQITTLLIQYKYFILFPVAVIEGPIATVIAGFLAATNYLDPYIAFSIIVSGDLVGDILAYAIGRWGREKLIIKWGYYLGVNSERLKKIEGHFERNTGKTLLLGKVLHGIGGTFLIAAGIAKVPILKFIWFNFLGTVPKSFILILIGFYFGYAISTIKSYLELIAAIFVGAGIIAILACLYFRKDKSIE